MQKNTNIFLCKTLLFNKIVEAVICRKFKCYQCNTNSVYGQFKSLADSSTINYTFLNFTQNPRDRYTFFFLIYSIFKA